MTQPDPTDAARWLALIANLPTEDPAARMRILRTLESLGAAVIREGAYLLPDNAACRQGVDRLAEYITKGAGSAVVMQVEARSPAQQQAFRGMFDRSTRYGNLMKVIDSLRVGFGIADPSALSRVLHKQRREFESISALDFFPTGMQEQVRSALSDSDAQVHRLMFPAQGAQAGAKPTEPMLRRTWATRKPAWADRLACAWLIRRFIDPEGTVLWLDKAQEVPADAVGFAYEGSRFGNSATQVTFEVMLQQFEMANNGPLLKMGAIVHYLEVRDVPVPEAAGVQTLLQGAMRRSTSDEELLVEAEKTFDLLYEAYLDAPGP